MAAHPTRLTTSARTILTTFALLLALPAAGQAATTFGSRLDHDPTTSGCGMLASCTLVSFINPIDPNGDPYAGGAPVDGVVTSVRLRAYATGAPTPVTLRVASIARPNPLEETTANAAATATGATVTIPVDDDGTDVPVHEFVTRMPIARGQHLGIDNTTVNAVYASSGSKFTYAFYPLLVDGQAARPSSDVTEELEIAATIEPDADRDGFGDETQDRCSTDATRQGACSDGRVTTPPLTIRGLRVSGGRITYTLGAAASVKQQVLRAVSGRKVGRRCVRPTRANAGKRHCTRFVKVGRTIVTSGKAGANAVPLPKPKGRPLAPGSYRVTVTARANGRAVSATAGFRVRARS